MNYECVSSATEYHTDNSSTLVGASSRRSKLQVLIVENKIHAASKSTAKTTGAYLVEVARHPSRVVRPAVLPYQPHVGGARFRGGVGPPLQPELDRPKVHGPLDDDGVVVKPEATPIDRVPESFGIRGPQQ